MENFKIISYFLLIVCFGYVSSQTYSILAPRIIRPRAEYNIIVALEGFDDIKTIRFTIEKTFGNKKVSYYQDVTFDKNNNFQTIKLQIDLDWTEGEYVLTIESINNNKIPPKQIPVEFLYKQFVILVQTDKAIYKPGQDVLFRTVILDDQLRPVDIEDINDLKIFLVDPQGVKLREFILANSRKGVPRNSYGINLFNYTKGVTQDIAFNIPDLAQPGQWNISVVTRGQVQNYTFFVDYYTLPLANVTIVVPELINFNNPILNYQVNAFYTFGKPVYGKAEVTIEKIRQCGTPINIKGIKKTFPISGQLKENIDLADLEFFNSNCTEMIFNLSAMVYDNKTNCSYFNYETFDVIKQDIKAEIEDHRIRYRPGKTVIQSFKLTSKSGKYIEKKVLNTFTCVAEFKSNISSEYKNLPVTNMFVEDGRIICEFKTQPGFTNVLLKLINPLLEAGSIIMETSFNFEKGCVDDTIQVNLHNKQEILYSEKLTSLIVQSTQNIENLIVNIVVRGSIINATLVSFEYSEKVQEIKLRLTREMVPEALVAVFMKIRNSGVIISDFLLLKVRGVFRNEVKFDVITPKLVAGEKAKIVISAESESRVFLLAIDEAVLALKQGNDINSKRVMQEFQFNNAYKEETDRFFQTGMNLITNSQKECSGQFYSVENLENFVSDANYGTKNTLKYFRETWIWDSTEIPHLKTRTSIMTKLPDSITTWKITGFAIHEQKGLGLTNNPGYVRVFRPFFIKLNLPYSIRRGEESEIHILVFNYLNETVKTELFLSINVTNSTALDFDGCDQKFDLSPNEIKTITCFVKSSIVGKIDINAQATAVSQSKKEYTYGEERYLLVIYEGFIQRKTKTIYFDLTSKDKDNHVEKVISVDFPKDRIHGSESVLLSATTELITVQWKDKLTSILKKYSNIQYDFTAPTKNCQQRVIYYFPKVYWLDYLNTTKRGSDQDISMAKKVVQTTIDYLCHQNPYDGSFVYYETWGSAGYGINNVVDVGRAKSFLWQTAFTVKLMNYAKGFVKVPEKSISDARDWITKQLYPNGVYIETDSEHSLYSTPTNAYLTAFVRIAMFEIGDVNRVTDQWMSDIFPKLNDPLDIMSTCYALNLVKSNRSTECYKFIENKMLVDNSSGNYWIGSNGQPDLHLTAYGLLTLTEKKSYALALNVFKYIASRQDTQGNFHSANDGWQLDSYITILCTEAMNKFIKLTNRYEQGIENVFVHFITDDKESVIHLRPKSDIVEVIEANPNTTRIKISATGYGRAKANLYLQYNTLNLDEGHFNINLTKRKHNDDYVELDICTNYKKEGNIRNGIVEIDLPSGYIYHEEKMIRNTDLIEKIESKNSDTHIIIYLKKIHQSDLCFSIPAVQSHAVKNRFPVNVKVYPYYDKSAMSVQTYEV